MLTAGQITDDPVSAHYGIKLSVLAAPGVVESCKLAKLDKLLAVRSSLKDSLDG